ncbi:hypothetical protein ACUPZ6_001936 [Campylobacter coli]
MISAIELSNITFNPSIQIIRFFKDYEETSPGKFEPSDDFDLSTELFFIDTKESIDNIIKLIILDPELTQSVKFGSIKYDFIINNKNLYRKIVIDSGSIIDKFSTIPFEYGYEEPSKDTLKEFNEFIEVTTSNYKFNTKNPKGIIITNTKDLKFDELNDFLRNSGSQTFFNTDARDFDILRRETTMVTPDNIFFNREGELVCVNDFIDPLNVFKRTTAMLLAS